MIICIQTRNKYQGYNKIQYLCTLKILCGHTYSLVVLEGRFD